MGIRKKVPMILERSPIPRKWARSNVGLAKRDLTIAIEEAFEDTPRKKVNPAFSDPTFLRNKHREKMAEKARRRYRDSVGRVAQFKESDKSALKKLKIWYKGKRKKAK